MPTANASCHCRLDVPPARLPQSASQHCFLGLLQKFPAAAERIQGVQVDQPPAMADLLSDMHKVCRQECCLTLLTGLVPPLVIPSHRLLCVQYAGAWCQLLLGRHSGWGP